jgi:hypothetical protein
MRSLLGLVLVYFFHNAWFSFERRNKNTSLSRSFPCTNIAISYKIRLKHTYVINTTLLALSLRHVSALKGPSSGIATDTFPQQGQQNKYLL